MLRRVFGLAAIAAVALLLPAPPAGAGQGIRLNHVQAIGTHNSYHLEASPLESAVRRRAGFDDSPLAYSHSPLAEQLERQEVRQLELDVFADPLGGLFAAPRLRELAGEPPYDPLMLLAATKVLHIQDYDYRSTCLTLVACLQEVRGWSRSHPRHAPVAILIELKDERLPPRLVGTVPLPWTAARLDGLDAEIRSVFGRRELIVPDDVRRGRRTLSAGLRRGGWPTLARARGRVMFLLANRGRHRRRYLAGHPALAGRVLFSNSRPGHPDAAFVVHDDPRGSGTARIRRLVRRGLLVRTRADADTIEARADDRRRARAALASGAHWVSTDYPEPGIAARFGSGYAVGLPGDAPLRCNPVTARRGCRLAPG